MLPRAARIKIATPALLLLVSQTRAVSTGDPVKDFGRAGIIFGFVVKFIDFGLLRQDGELYKLKDRDGTQAQNENAGIEKDMHVKGDSTSKSKSRWQKFKDSAELWLFTMRGVGWNWQVGGIPEREPQSSK
jgi:exopolysaccharide biosynthesis protein